MRSKIYIEDIHVIKMFIGEWMESFQGLEKEILKLEVQWEDVKLLDDILKCIHGIKGMSSFVGVWGITRLSYEIEITIEVISSGKVTENTDLIDILLLSVDFLKAYVKMLYEKLNEYDFKDENTLMYLEFENDQNEEQLLESLKLTRDKLVMKELEEFEPYKETSQEESGVEVLQSEDFKIALADGIKEQFLFENTEHIENMENYLLIPQSDNSNHSEVINELFREAHSIKGDTGVYLATLPTQSCAHKALKKLSDDVHTFESLLAVMRDKGFKFEKNLVDLSLSVMDYLKSFINVVALDEFYNFPDDGAIDIIKKQTLSFEALPSNLGQNTTTVTQRKSGKAEDIKPKVSVNQSIRVNERKIDNMMNMISELVIAKNSFMHISSKLDLEYDIPEMSKEVNQVGAYVKRISDELQNAIMSIRMLEIKTVFQKMPRVIRDIAKNTGKHMKLHMEGEGTEIDKTIIEQIRDPLVHLIRNAADHGIEDPEDRLLKGKPDMGIITLRAYNKNKHVFIEIEDDGNGIDAEKLKIKAIEKGMISENKAEKMNQNQLINLIFLPGFSMSKQITEVSGRGVGMDIVKSNISKINGTITIESEVGKGTKMIIQLPLTLAVSHGLVVEVAGDNYIIPLENIVETAKINRSSIHKFNERYFTYLRGNAMGIEWLSKVFLTGERDTEKEELNAVILSNGNENYAIVVDKLKNEQEFVVKTLDGYLAGIQGISGSTLLGNGQVVLIVNPADIIQLAEKQNLVEVN